MSGPERGASANPPKFGKFRGSGGGLKALKTPFKRHLNGHYLTSAHLIPRYSAPSGYLHCDGGVAVYFEVYLPVGALDFAGESGGARLNSPKKAL